MIKASVFLIVLILISGCIGSGAIPIKELKADPDGYLGRSVVVEGTVIKSLKVGRISGFTLSDGSGESLLVFSEDLPAEGSKALVRGTMMREALVGDYLLAMEISD